MHPLVASACALARRSRPLSLTAITTITEGSPFMRTRTVLSVLHRPALLLSLTCCLVVPACGKSSGDDPLSEVLQGGTPWEPEILEARIFDVAPDDPRKSTVTAASCPSICLKADYYCTRGYVKWCEIWNNYDCEALCLASNHNHLNHAPAMIAKVDG